MPRGTTRKTKTTRTATICGLIALMLLLSTLIYHQKLNAFKTMVQEQRAEISGLQHELGVTLERLHTVEKELEEHRGSAHREDIEEKYELVRLLDIDPTFVIDLKYATRDNFVGRQVYPDNSAAVLRKSTALKLKTANGIFKQNGYRIKVLDAYRPQHVQYVFWYFMPDIRFVADPLRGSKHNRGASVDITLVDQDGNEIGMGTEFDDFTERAAYDYPGHTETARKNMKYLRDVMEEAGFQGISTEWWHFDDVGWQEYDLLDVGFEGL